MESLSTRLLMRVLIFFWRRGLVCLRYFSRRVITDSLFVCVLRDFWADVCVFPEAAFDPAHFRFGVGLGGLGIYPRASVNRFWLGDAGAFAV